MLKEVKNTFKTKINKHIAKKSKRYLESDINKHAAHEVLRQKQILKRPVNLDNPKYFFEKLLWLKYNIYNPSPLVAQCYNKYEARKYVESKGYSNILNDLYGVWDHIDDIPWDALPGECVIKVSNGYAGHVFKRENTPFIIKDAKKTIIDTWNRSKFMFYISGDLFAYNTEQKIICERLLEPQSGYLSPADYKFYCFHGEPLYIDFLYGRGEAEKGAYNEHFYDINLNDRHELEGGSSPGSFEKPSCFDDMIEIARVLSSDFPFVRVDLYEEHNKPIFGELTFSPFHKATLQSEVELGELINLNNIYRYKNVLSKTIGLEK